MLNLPALRCKVENWTYYVSSFTYEQVSLHVKRIDKELHSSKSLQDQIQRTINENYLSIRDYILKQDEHFFNALVLAVYGGMPEWVEVELDYKGEDYFNLGFLVLKGGEKIFPVDGQHRVEGIKAALLENPSISLESIPVILIGHKNTPDGMVRTRRLFSTLNRYAKPVTLGDIIALDEDDTVAIATRELVENHPLFSEDRTVFAKQKAMPERDTSAITSLITLYQCNVSICKYLFEGKYSRRPTKKVFDEFLKIRPKDEAEVDYFKKSVFRFWTDFSENLTVIEDYLNTEDKPAKKYRNPKNGGNLLFRPVGLLPFVEACLIIKKRTSDTFSSIMLNFNQVNMNMNSKPWQQVLWNTIEKKMIMGSSEVVKLLLLYSYDSDLLTTQEFKKMTEGYASKINYEGKVEEVMSTF